MAGATGIPGKESLPEVRVRLGSHVSELILPPEGRAKPNPPPSVQGGLERDGLIVIDLPSIFVYDSDERSFTTPAAAFISLKACRDTVYAIRVAPQLEYQGLDDAIRLAEELVATINAAGWPGEPTPGGGLAPIRERLTAPGAKEAGLAILERWRVGEETAYVVVQRAYRAGGLVDALVKRTDRFLVNVVLNHESLERSLLRQIWPKRDQSPNEASVWEWLIRNRAK
jgi:hypothetical protein